MDSDRVINGCMKLGALCEGTFLQNVKKEESFIITASYVRYSSKKYYIYCNMTDNPLSYNSNMIIITFKLINSKEGSKENNELPNKNN